MGLDMYLNAKRFFWHNETPPVLENLLDPFKVRQVEVEACYWRKANQIHGWFVREVQGGEDECREHDVSVEQLLSLVDTCKRALALKDDPDAPTKVLDLLPPCEGFFFGSSDIDEYYWAALQHTVDQITTALNAMPPYGYMIDGVDAPAPCGHWSYHYCSSW